MTTYNLPIPPSTNNLFFNLPKGGRAPTAEYKSWQEVAGWMLKSQKPKPAPVPFRIDIKISDRARLDCDNALKAPLDLLRKHGVIKDDNKTCLRGLSIDYVDGIDGMQVRITSLALLGSQNNPPVTGWNPGSVAETSETESA